MTMIYVRHNSFYARSKKFSWKLRPYYGYLRENIYNEFVQSANILFMLWIKYKFLECLASPLHKHGGPQWKAFWRLFCPGSQTRGDSGQLPPNFLCLSKFCCAQKKLLSKYDEHKKLSPLKLYSPPTLQPGYESGSAKIVSTMRIFCFEGHSVSRCHIMSKTFFINYHWGAPVSIWGEQSCAVTALETELWFCDTTRHSRHCDRTRTLVWRF